MEPPLLIVAGPEVGSIASFIPSMTRSNLAVAIHSSSVVISTSSVREIRGTPLVSGGCSFLVVRSCPVGKQGFGCDKRREESGYP